MYLTRTNLQLPCIWNPVTTILTRNTCIAEAGWGGVGEAGGGIKCQVWTGERIGVNVQTN